MNYILQFTLYIFNIAKLSPPFYISTWHLFLPPSLARYKAASARFKNVSVVSCGLNVVMPALNVTVIFSPDLVSKAVWAKRVHNLSAIKVASSISVFSRITTNSSPPYLQGMSLFLVMVLSIDEKNDSNISPSICPYMSLNRLK